MGEITQGMTTAIVSCRAAELLVPIKQPHVELIGLEARPLSAVLDELATRVVELIGQV